MKKTNVGIVTLVNKASSVSMIYSKSCYSTISNVQYCKNAGNVSTVRGSFKDDSQSVLRSLSTQVFINIMDLTRWMLLITNYLPYI